MKKKAKKFNKEDIKQMLKESNAIEGVYSSTALQDAEKAWKYIAKKDFVTDKTLLHIHKILLGRISPRIAGKFRTCDVWIGGNHKKFIDADILLFKVKQTLTAIDTANSFKGKKDVIAKECHVLFEDAHPFEDGNGRVGRILYNWHRLQLGLPIHIIKHGDDQMAYYKWFKK